MQRPPVPYLRYARSGHCRKVSGFEPPPVPSPRGWRRPLLVLGAIIAPALCSVFVTGLRRSTDGAAMAAPLVTPVGASHGSQKAPQQAAPVKPAPVEPTPDAALPETSPQEAAKRTHLRRAVRDRLRPAEALSSALSRSGVSAADVSGLVRDLRGTLDLRSLRAGARFVVELLPDESDRASFRLATFVFHTTSPQGVPRIVQASREDVVVDAREAPASPRFSVDVIDAAVDTAVEGVSGRVSSNLYNAMLESGEEASLVDKFVDVFAWNIDFYRQTQAGDEFRVLVEKRYAGEGSERRFLGYGRVVAAEYVNAGTGFRGFAFSSKDEGITGYFDEAGESIERTFLKNPMEVARITSSFGMRFHPVLGRNKKHEGIDYGAPVGTPVWSVADGVVVEAKYSKTAGNMVLIQHVNKIETEYFHFSKIAPGVKAGTRVKQKQLIGFVGSTGLSTGPHLHFGMRRLSDHVDPSKQKFPSARPVPNKYRAEFSAFVAPLLEQLRALDRV